MQAGVGLGFGLPVGLSGHALSIVLNIAATVAVYVGLLTLEKIFGPGRFPKAMGAMALLVSGAIGVCTATGIRPWFLVFGFVSGLFLRTVPSVLSGTASRFAAVVLCFGSLGILFTSAGHRDELAHHLASWATNGAGYQLMTLLAIRVERALSKGLLQF